MIKETSYILIKVIIFARHCFKRIFIKPLTDFTVVFSIIKCLFTNLINWGLRDKLPEEPFVYTARPGPPPPLEAGEVTIQTS